MNVHTDAQIIMQEGRPAFVVISYNDYIRLRRPFVPDDGESVPNDVVWLTIDKGYALVRAWREYLGLTQKEVAEKMGITQAALSQMESGEKKLRKATLEKLAEALGVNIEQIRG
ncbi:MAG: helix-turn-helix transcriptional regulator [Pseudomonadota bacterium]